MGIKFSLKLTSLEKVVYKPAVATFNENISVLWNSLYRYWCTSKENVIIKIKLRKYTNPGKVNHLKTTISVGIGTLGNISENIQEYIFPNYLLTKKCSRNIEIWTDADFSHPLGNTINAVFFLWITFRFQ